MIARARCMTCWKYLRRTGRDRPEELIIALTSRDVERELSARLCDLS